MIKSLWCIACGDDGVIWQLFPNHNSLNGVEVTPRPTVDDASLTCTLADCLALCSTKSSCLAVDFNEATSRCYQFADRTFVESRGRYPNVHQFVAERCDPGTSSNYMYIECLHHHIISYRTVRLNNTPAYNIL